jgi:hypothetical protein
MWNGIKTGIKLRRDRPALSSEGARHKNKNSNKHLIMKPQVGPDTCKIH